MDLYQAVAVEEDAVFLSENGFYLLIAHLGHKPQGHPPGSQFLNLVTTPEVGQVVARVGVGEPTTIWVEDGIEAGHFFAESKIYTPRKGRRRSLTEAPILVENREELNFLLTEASELEHMVMLAYLFAAFSLKTDASEGLTEEQLEAVKRWEQSNSIYSFFRNMGDRPRGLLLESATTHKAR
jgi:hypothetical protein